MDDPQQIGKCAAYDAIKELVLKGTPISTELLADPVVLAVYALYSRDQLYATGESHITLPGDIRATI